MAPAASPLRPSLRSWSLFNWSRGDKIAFAIFVLVPLALYVPASIAGHPTLPGDDLVQNFPLRVLVGDALRSGRLPAWDPMIWSGTPLLAGWNAGAMFPGTFIFAILPPLTAWTVNLLIAPVCASTGLYLLARRLHCGELGAALGALVFTYTGFMQGQIVHVGLLQGTAFTPWMLLGLDALLNGTTRRGSTPRRGADGEGGPNEVLRSRWLHRLEKSAADRSSALGWVAVFAVAFALTVLAGDPRAVSSAAVICLVYLIACCWRGGANSLHRVGAVAVGLALGALLSAIQWLPGLGFLNASQRSGSAISFFGSGSLGLRELATLMVAPFILGGNGSLGQPIYVGSYNLPEVTVGVGLVGLVAFSAYLPELGSSFLSFVASRGRRPRLGRDRPGLGVWYALVIVGAVLTIGTNEPLGRLLVHVPLYGGERLQNRNAVIFDLALSILVCFFVDDIGRRSRRDAAWAGGSAAGRSAGDPFRYRGVRFLGVIPVVFALALIAIDVAAPLGFQSFLHVTGQYPRLTDELAGYLIATALVALSLAMFWILEPRLSRRVATLAVAGLVVCDVGIYIANASFASMPSSILTSATPYSSGLKHDLGRQGRFSLFNPAFQVPGNDPEALTEVGVTDLNILQDNPSVSGYGSIVNGVYQTNTGTHLFEYISPRVLKGEAANTLDLRILLTLPIYFGEVIAPGAPIPLPDHQSTARPGTPSSEIPRAPPDATGPWTIPAGASFEWLLPTPSKVSHATIVFSPGLAAVPSKVRLELTGPGSKSVSITAPTAGFEARGRFAGGPVGNAIMLKNTSRTPVVVAAVLVLTAKPENRLVLDGALQGALGSPHWTYTGTIGPLLAFKNNLTRGIAWLQPVHSPTPNTAFHAPGKVELLNDGAIAPQVMTVDSPRPSTLVRSEGYAPGWTARLTPIGGGPTRVLKVYRFGLIQAVNFPAGQFTVTWRYAPTGILEGLLGSLVGFVALLAILASLIMKTARVKTTGREVAPEPSLDTSGTGTTLLASKRDVDA